MSGIRLGHVFVVTTDLDRLRTFYEHTLGLRLVAVDRSPMPAGDRLGVFADDRAVTMLALERPGVDLGIGGELGERGPIDHFTFHVDAADFDRSVARLVAAGASDGDVRPLGPMFGIRFSDPDGRSCNLCRPNPDWEPPADVDVLVPDVVRAMTS